MTENTSSAESERWKRKYYDHLDLLDKKEKSWEQLEAVLKKAVLRLSLAAEGQHTSIDQHLFDIRGVVKQQVNAVKLESILEELSRLLVRLESKMGAADSKVVGMLAYQLERLDVPASENKRKNKLIKKLSKASDKDREKLSEEVHDLLATVVRSEIKTDGASASPGLLSALFGKNAKDTESTHSYQVVAKAFVRVGESLPWPEELAKDAHKYFLKLGKSHSDDEISEQLDLLYQLANLWQKQSSISGQSNDVGIVSDNIENINPNNIDDYRQCLNTVLLHLKQADLLRFETTLIENKINNANVKGELEDISKEMAHMMAQNTGQETNDSVTISGNQLVKNITQEPSIKEVLIRLLEQLMVQPDLHNEVESLKLRIENESSESSWGLLLKDVAQLINTIRSRMQEEKHEFETFLQQVTGRLKEMDGFLEVETASLNIAEKTGSDFDAEVISHVQDMRDDIDAAENLNDLKSKVENRLDIVSNHIKKYRKTEQERYTNAKKNVDDMQSKLSLLEQEAGDLKRLIREKNKEAMFDVLTGIPNRLSYEKRAAEEIARCNRFDSSLCMAVWDVDLFKQVNDTYGHKAGDRVLNAVAQLLNDRIRETDFIARYGGEEFVMFLPGIEESEAMTLADSLREKVASCKFNHNGKITKITVSCGISSFSEGDSHEAMFERADRALYTAKHNGRNQCVMDSTVND